MLSRRSAIAVGLYLLAGCGAQADDQRPVLNVGSGAVDVGLVGDAPFQFARASGAPILAIGAQTTTGQRPDEALAIIVRPESAVRRLADFRGKTVATTRGSIATISSCAAWPPLDCRSIPYG